MVAPFSMDDNYPAPYRPHCALRPKECDQCEFNSTIPISISATPVLEDAARYLDHGHTEKKK